MYRDSRQTQHISSLIAFLPGTPPRPAASAHLPGLTLAQLRVESRFGSPLCGGQTACEAALGDVGGARDEVTQRRVLFIRQKVCGAPEGLALSPGKKKAYHTPKF